MMIQFPENQRCGFSNCPATHSEIIENLISHTPTPPLPPPRTRTHRLIINLTFGMLEIARHVF